METVRREVGHPDHDVDDDLEKNSNFEEQVPILTQWNLNGVIS